MTAALFELIMLETIKLNIESNELVVVYLIPYIACRIYIYDKILYIKNTFVKRHLILISEALNIFIMGDITMSSLSYNCVNAKIIM